MNNIIKKILNFAIYFAKDQIDEVSIYIINKYASDTQKELICKNIKCKCLK